MKRLVLVGLAVVLAVVGVMLLAPRDTDAAVRAYTAIGISEDGQWFRCSARDLWPAGKFWMRLDDLATTYSDDLRPTIPEGDWGYIGRKDPRFLAYAKIAWPNRTF